MPESGKISLESMFFRRILENFGRNLGFSPDFGNFGQNLEIFRSVQVFQVLRQENRNSTRRSWFLVMKTRRRHAGVVGSAGFGLDLVGSSGGSGFRMNLDSSTSKI